MQRQAQLGPEETVRRPRLKPVASPAMQWNYAVLAYMVAVHATALWSLWAPVRPVWIAVAIGMYFVFGIGTTVGLLRLVCHRAFACPRWLEYVLISMAMPTGQGSPLLWAATHGLHHAYSDTDRDPHSPARSFWYGHIGWFVNALSTRPDDWQTWCRDIGQDPYYLWLLRFRMVPQVVVVTCVALLLGWRAVPFCFYLPAVLWMHATYAVNSLCHLPNLGQAPHATGEHSRNFLPIGLLALGEGWHNHHHAFPRSARHGLGPRQPDVAFAVIKTLQFAGLAWNVRGPGHHVDVVRRQRLVDKTTTP